MSLPKKRITTATARAEHTERQTPIYDPREKIAPVQPSAFVSGTQVKYDDFLTARQYMRANPQGESERRFDAEKHPATREYRERIEAQRLDNYVDMDMLIEEERDAALVEQPPEAIQQFEHDLQNPRLLNILKGPVTRSAQPSAELQRRQALQRVADKRLKAVAAAMANQTDQDPDFFTRIAGYQEPKKAATSGRDNALLAAIDNEIADLADNEDIDDDNEFTNRRAELEQERAALLADAAAQQAQEEEEEEQQTSAQSSALTRKHGQLVPEQIARQLLDPDPLTTLHTSMRTYFLSLPEPSLVCRLLRPLLLQHEQHRQHVNVIELIRALTLCGAKYDGFNVLRSKRPLSALLDERFYAAHFDQQTGALLHGHEHYERGETKFVVFKFFLVRRNKTNDELLAKADTKVAGKAAAGPTEITDEQATNIDNRLDENDRYKHLNKAGLYDADQGVEDVDDDGTDEYGSMHDIKYLEREFMFSLRVVCVQPPVGLEVTQHGYASQDDDDFVLPHGCTEEAEEAPEEQTVHLESLTSQRLQSTTTDSRRRQSGSNSNFAGRGSSALQEEEDAVEDDDPVAYDDPAFVHTDDENDDDEIQAQMAALRTKEFWPRETLSLSLEQAEQLVGKWKAKEFLDRIERQTVGVLCIRSFMFYATAKPT